MAKLRKIKKNSSGQLFASIVILFLVLALLATLLIVMVKKLNDNVPFDSDPLQSSSDIPSSDTPSSDDAPQSDTPTSDIPTSDKQSSDTQTPASSQKPVEYDGKKLIAFTFDDGPDASGEKVNKIVEKLKTVDGKCTFFVLASTLNDKNSKAIHDAYEAGMEIGSHSVGHPNFYNMTVAEQISEVKKANDLIEKAMGARPKLFRAPYGNLDHDLAKQVFASEPMTVVKWSVDTEDWKYKKDENGAEQIVANIKRDCYDGAIVLMHCIYQNSVDAFCEAVDILTADGYKFVTVSEILGDIPADPSIFHYARGYSRSK
ncbi:MAG: polysaccharide deacetylase family protein [Clostridia bacterium]|nr:polysaccharide deacetylase family protein [Clostridia bacterium]